MRRGVLWLTSCAAVAGLGASTLAIADGRVATHASVAVSQGLPTACSSGNGTPDCIGALPRNWHSLSEAEQRKIFARIWDDFREPSKVAAGAIGGITKTAQDEHNWKKVEALADAHLFSISRTKVPTVVAVLNLVRGSGETHGTKLNPNSRAQFLVVYPGMYDEPGDVVDNDDPNQGYFRLVTVVNSWGPLADRVDIQPAKPGVTVCETPHEPNDFSYARFHTCAIAKIPEESRMRFLSYTDSQAWTALQHWTGSEVDSLALAEILNHARSNYGSQFRTVESTPIPESHRLIRFFEAGVWFSCALGCCYANTLLR